MKVNIVCDEAGAGWIYDQFVDAFKKYSKHEILINNYDCDLIHFLPYYLTKSINKPSTAWFSHQEIKDPLKSKFISSGKSVDFAISQSKKYADILEKSGIKNVTQIVPGIDLDRFKMRSTKRSKSNKLKLGYVGRQYSSSNRKNPNLLKRISKLPFVDFRTTGGKLTAKEIPGFYSRLDFIISPALVEGGAMCITEGLGVGTPTVCFENVGVADEFDLGVIKIPFNDSDAFVAKLEELHRIKGCLYYRKQHIMEQMREQVAAHSVENFAKEHDKIWDEVLAK